jgi:hypothetical protein
MKAERASYGRQTACEYCGTDVEWHGKRRRRNDGSVLADKITGGWMDRGGNTQCQRASGKYDQDGVPVPNRVRLHKGML